MNPTTPTLTRRGFLASAVGLTAGLILPRPAAAASPYYRAIRYDLADNFNRTELAVIGQAMNLVARRMLDPRMFRYAKANYRNAYTRVPGRSFRTGAEFEAWFTQVQIAALLDRGFPILRLSGQYDPRGGWTGRAPIGTVVTDYRTVVQGRTRGNVFVVEGDFQVRLNTGLLGSSSFYLGTCPHYWAGVIAHEMLHNLGHEHPANVYEGTFIRAYERAVWFDADPKRTDSRPNCCG
jgi:hypothetical protein